MSSFSDLPLSAPLLRAISELGFETPSPIQAETLPMLLGEPTDFLGLAATGTGKTAAFGLPMLEKIDMDVRGIQAVILCPTRELALQVSGQITLLGKYKGVKVVTVYGGASYADQIRGLKMGASVVVGTPGRVVDHITRGTLKLDKAQVVILDEADEMISMGFKEDLETVLNALPQTSDDSEVEIDEDGNEVESKKSSKKPERQSQIWLFSATMSREVRRVADAYLRKPKQVQVNRKEMLPSTVEQFYYPTRESDKPEILVKLIEAAEDFYGLIFCQTKALVIDLTAHLVEKGYKVDCLHGDKDQNSRERTMQSFRDRKVRILVCTDVASRGLDVKDITHVINYSLPRELDNYVHRIGRTARSGKTGIAMNLVTASHRRLIFDIENLTKTKMIEGKIPSRREIGGKKISKMLATFSDQPFHSRASEVMSEEWKTALATMTPEEVAGRFLSMMMPDVFGERTERSQALGISAEQRESRSSSGGGTRDSRERRSDGPRGDSRGPRREYSDRGPRSAPSERPTPAMRASGSGRPERAEPRFESESVPAAPRAPSAPRSNPARSAAAEFVANAMSPDMPVLGKRDLSEQRPVRKARFSSEIKAAKANAPVRKSGFKKKYDSETSDSKITAKPRLREIAEKNPVKDPMRHMDSVEKSLTQGPSRKERRAAQFGPATT